MSPRGSSPLTRGKPFAAFVTASRTGLIPAHAGKTSSTASKHPSTWAHPRSRGENKAIPRASLRALGSSPLTRGKLRRRRPTPARPRLIPAHAGKTSRARPTMCGQWAHPRSRGENALASTLAASVGGSSPLTRGKQRGRRLGRDELGLIPAHAGKTPRALTDLQAAGAHPRSRGENLGEWHPVGIGLGSSPLTRGKLTGRDSDVPGRGLIPAHAGKTAMASSTA